MADRLLPLLAIMLLEAVVEKERSYKQEIKGC